MRLLIVTQKIDKNDSILGFFHRWVEEFARHYEKITVICLEEGEHDLPENVQVFSLGKEKLSSLPTTYYLLLTTKLKYVWNFYKYIFKFRRDYDVVFVHMNQVYVILGGLFWHFWRKPIGLWYVHKQVGLSLKIAVLITDYIFSVSKESFRYPTKKLKLVGHGIDLERFKSACAEDSLEGVRLITTGRIAPVKNIDVIVEALSLFNNLGGTATLSIVGEAVLPEDKRYEEKLKSRILELGLNDAINFLGSIPNTGIPALLQKHDLFINLSNTGSVDKAVLEAMAAGIKVLTSNEAFAPILEKKNLTELNPKVIAEKIELLLQQPNDPELRKYVFENHNMKKLISKMTDIIKNK